MFLFINILIEKTKYLKSFRLQHGVNMLMTNESKSVLKSTQPKYYSFSCKNV